MKRNIIKIDEEKCNGCGLCVNACHEGALQLVDGKARLVSESYCDGLGNCLPECPTGAITIEEREAAAYDEESVKINMSKAEVHGGDRPVHVCPGTMARPLVKKPCAPPPLPASSEESPQSELGQWPCQLKLVPVNAPYLENAHLVIAADCTAFARADIHRRFMRNKITLIGCPKLDDIDYSEKLAAILKAHEIQSVTVLRMEVPCCGGIVHAVKNALISSGKMIPWSVVTISIDGNILE